MTQITQKTSSSAPSRPFRWRRFKWGPLAVWILAVIIGVCLYSQSSSDIEIMGIVESRDFPVSAVRDVRIQELLVDLFDQVQKNQPLALVQDASLRAEYLVLESNLRRLRFEWEENKDQWEKIAQNPDIKNALSKLNDLKDHLDYAERSVIREIDHYNLFRLTKLLERRKRLMDENITGTAPFDDVKREIDALSLVLKSHEESLNVLENRIREARRRSENRPESTNDKIRDEWLKEFGEEIIKIQSGLKLLTEKKNYFEIKAPVSGVASEIFHRTGDLVFSGNPILNLSGGDALKATAYLKEDQSFNICAGAPVKVFSRVHPELKFSASILKIGPQMIETPRRLWRAISIPEWGAPVVIGDLPGDMFRPGELVDIQIMSKRD